MIAINFAFGTCFLRHPPDVISSLRHFNICASSLPSQLPDLQVEPSGDGCCKHQYVFCSFCRHSSIHLLSTVGVVFPLLFMKTFLYFLQLYFSLRHLYDHSNLSFHSTLLLLNSKLSRSTRVCQVMWLPHREL